VSEHQDRRPPARAHRPGDVLGDGNPKPSQDERPEAWGDVVDDADEALLREVPPHHERS
jgi:hypothetical protein